MEDHRIRVLKHQEAEAKRQPKDLKTRRVEALESIATHLKRLADATREEPNRG